MNKNKSLIILLITFFLNGCVQSSAMLGPAITLVSTGNIAQASLSFSANKAVEEETGMSTTEFISQKLNNENNLVSEEFEKDFFDLLEANINKTRNIISED